MHELLVVYKLSRHVHPYMKTTIAYILTCVSVVAAGTNDVQVFTTTDTHTQPGILITLDTFTRAGQTNLLRDMRTKDGVLTIRNQTFCHDGVQIGGYVTYPTTSFSYSVAGAPYSMSFQYDASNHVRSALVTSNLMMLEAFGCTNGVFYSEDSAFIQKADTAMLLQRATFK
jgi:hypothetical protein